MLELYENYNQRRIVGQLSTMVEINHGQKEHNLCSGWLSIQDLKSVGQGLVWDLGVTFACMQDFVAL